MTRHFTMYTSKDCAQCEFMRGFLTDLGITYEEIDTDNRTKYLSELEAMGVKTKPYLELPVMIESGQPIWWGIDYAKMNDLLDEAMSKRSKGRA